MQAVIDGMQNSFSMAAGSAGLSAIFLACMLVLWNYKFESRNEIKLLFWYGLLMLIILISPMYSWVVKRFLPELISGNMYLWVLPVVPVIIFVAVVVISRLDNNFKKVAFAFGLVGIVILATTTSYVPNEIRLVENEFYIDSKELGVLEEVVNYTKRNGLENAVVWGPDEIIRDARIYDARIYTIYGKDIFEGQIDSQMHHIYSDWDIYAYNRMEAGNITSQDIAAVAENIYFDAIILHSDSFNEGMGENPPNVINMGFYLIYSDDNYCLYTRKR